MSIADILPPSGLKRLVEGFLQTVAISLARLRPGGLFAHLMPNAQVGLLNRLIALLRVTFVILACTLDLKPVHKRARPCVRAASRAPHGLTFRLFPPFRFTYDDDLRNGAPRSFTGGACDCADLAARKAALLARVLANPAPYVTRMARRLPAQLMVIGARPARHPPRGPAREIWEALCEAMPEAWAQLRDFRRRTRDMAPCPTPAA